MPVITSAAVLALATVDLRPLHMPGQLLDDRGFGQGDFHDPALLDVAARAMAAATLRALRADLRVLSDWARQQPVTAPPVAPVDLAAFVRAQALAGKKPATLARYVSSVSTWHRLLRLPDPARDPLVRLELKAQRRLLGVRQRQAEGLRFRGNVADPLLAAGPVGVCVEAMLAAAGNDLAGKRDRALLSLAYDTGLRRSEIVAVLWPHVTQVGDAGRLFVPRSKTDTEGAGSYAFLSARTMAALANWRSVIGIEGAVFRRLHRARCRDTADVCTSGAQLSA